LEKNRSNKNNSCTGFIVPLIILILIVSSCNPTKYIPQDETLLDENHVIINKEGIRKSEIEPYIKQHPNKRIFGARFHLGLYNLSNLDKEKWPHSWLREIGEEPVVFDPYATAKSTEQIKSYVASKGFFDSDVMETIETANKKSKVYYNVDLKSPYTIRNLYYEIEDTTIRNYLYFDSINCLIERGKAYDVAVLTAERSRFERFIKNCGFYAFSGDHISFRVDSTIGNRQVNIYYGIKKFQKIDEFNRATQVLHSVYWVRNVYIFPDFVPKDALEGGDLYLKSLDTVYYKGYYFISTAEKPPIKYDLILQTLYVKPGAIYNVTNTEQTQSHLLSLKTFRLVNVFYREVNEAPENRIKDLTLDCNIQLTLLKQQSYKVDLEGTNSAGYIGGALNLIYQHKNLFHGAELFNLKLKGAFEGVKQQDTLRSVQEYGIETSLRFPRFLLPFLEKESFIKKYNPTTTLLAAWNYQNMPYYERTIANATFGYNWNGKNYTSHIVNPVQMNLVNLLWIDPGWKAWLDSSSYLASSYSDVLILGGGYSYIFNNQKIQKSKDYWFVRVNAETSGNMLGLVSKMAKLEKTGGSYNIFKQPYAQYVRVDMDARYNIIINDVSSMVYRTFIGAGIPYGNSKAIPFEKQYFGGGANGIRAWQVRTLGPGSYVPLDSGFLNQTADIKIEANAEYRFKLFWILQGAVFLDAGNIWSYNSDPARPGSQFVLSKFYKDIAVGTGAGIRLDLSFVLMRVDMGMKLRDPMQTGGSKWIMMNRPYNFKDDFTFVIAIGYPF
jgi:hypothetical protein